MDDLIAEGRAKSPVWSIAVAVVAIFVVFAVFAWMLEPNAVVAIVPSN